MRFSTILAFAPFILMGATIAYQDIYAREAGDLYARDAYAEADWDDLHARDAVPGQIISKVQGLKCDITRAGPTTPRKNAERMYSLCKRYCRCPAKDDLECGEFQSGCAILCTCGAPRPPDSRFVLDPMMG